MFFQLRGGYLWQRWLCLPTYVNTILVNCFALQHIFPLASRNVIFLVHLSCHFAQSARCGKCQTIQNFTRHCCVIQISASRFHMKFPSTFFNVIIIIDLSLEVPLRYSYIIWYNIYFIFILLASSGSVRDTATAKASSCRVP